MTGLEFLAQLCPEDTVSTPRFAVVMLTGMASEEVAGKALRAGAQDYLVKDRITAEGLSLAVRKATEKVGLIRALQGEKDLLARSLAEKEVLIQEVHHRVKNNLAVIASLLRLQASNLADESLAAVLRESQHRVESMALIHEQLYTNGDLREVDLAQHAALLAGSLFHSYGIEPARISWSVAVDPLPLGVDQAIPAGLILNELVSNALKHVHSQDGRTGSVVIEGGPAERKSSPGRRGRRHRRAARSRTRASQVARDADRQNPDAPTEGYLRGEPTAVQPDSKFRFRRRKMDNKACKVLVVEDEGLIAHDIASRLTAMGHEVVGTAGTADEAMELAAGADIVLMDIRIDGPIDGVEAAARIRDRYRLPVVFLTAHSDRPTLDRAKVTGAFAYLVKPIAHASLNTGIEIALYKHRMERKLEEREALLRTTLSSVADAVVVTDDRSHVLMLNAAAEGLCGWKQAEAEGKPVLRVLGLIDGESGEPAEDPVPLAILKDAPMALDKTWQLVSRSGFQMKIEGSAAPVKASGLALGTVLTVRDVSARVWEEKQLRQAQKVDAAGRMAARVSNEYTSLLANIRTHSEQLLRQIGEYSPARQSIEEIQESAAAAEALTRQADPVRHPASHRTTGVGECQRHAAPHVETDRVGRWRAYFRGD